MEIVAHALWTGAAAVAAKRRSARVSGLSTQWAAFWGTFPDVFAFGPAIAVGLWMSIVNGTPVGRRGAHFNIGISLYSLAHSLITFTVVFLLASLLARRLLLPMLGWLMHILIDIPTHSYDYYATKVFWPLSNWGFDGLPWWTPWFWVSTYVALATVYAVMWRKGWLGRELGANDPPHITQLQ